MAFVCICTHQKKSDIQSTLGQRPPSKQKIAFKLVAALATGHADLLPITPSRIHPINACFLVAIWLKRIYWIQWIVIA